MPVDSIDLLSMSSSWYDLFSNQYRSVTTKKILVLTGKRGGYGAMKPMLRAINSSSSLELVLAATDQHLDPKFGSTVVEIEKEFEVHCKIPLNQQDSSSISRSHAIGLFVQLFSRELVKYCPDLCLLFGDRSEVLAAALACNIMNVPIGHIQGGDLSGSTDENFRHAITKLSNYHFASCAESADRIIQLGEDPRKVHIVGDCHIDEMIGRNFSTQSDVLRQLKLHKSKKIVVLLQHSETTQPQHSFHQMKNTLLALNGLNDVQIVAVYPCSDPGYEGIVQAYNQFKSDIPCLSLYKNLDAPLFWGLLATADVLLGNSSSGIVESPVFKLPTINVGRRQVGRTCADNVIHVDHNTSDIRQALLLALYDQTFKDKCAKCVNPYGHGDAGLAITKILANLDLTDPLILQKSFNHLSR